jgi:hypothetical protein
VFAAAVWGFWGNGDHLNSMEPLGARATYGNQLEQELFSAVFVGETVHLGRNK